MSLDSSYHSGESGTSGAAAASAGDDINEGREVGRGWFKNITRVTWCLFSCGQATLQGALSVHLSVHPSVHLLVTFESKS